MLDYSEASIKQMVIHRLGCKKNGIPNEYSNCTFAIPDSDSPLPELLKIFFLSNFKPDIQYHFDGIVDNTEGNPVYTSVHNFFNNQESFFEESINIAEHWVNQFPDTTSDLYELYVVEFENIKVHDTLIHCIGIFVSEEKDSFLKILPQNNNFSIEPDRGINLKKLDKGCLVFEMDINQGYVVSTVNSNKKKGANIFWQELFLRLSPRHDNFFFTQNYLSMCKGFVEQVYNETNEVPRTEQIDLLNRSYNFFQNNKNFTEDLFTDQVISNPEVQDAFLDYKNNFQQENMVPDVSNFTISGDAVKKQNRFFKSVIKLDKNFHVYVHGNRNFIEKGYDPRKGMSYYQLFFDAEN